jgi:hypothetical protein
MRLLESALALLVLVAAGLRRQPAPRLPPGVDAEDLAHGYERSDARVGWIIASGLALVAVLGIVLTVATTLEATVTGIPATITRPPDLVNRLEPAPTPPPPRLETAEGSDYAAYQAAKQQRLNSYAWVDRPSGRVSIPVARAMDLVAQRGLPSRPAAGARDNGLVAPSSASAARVDERVGR